MKSILARFSQHRVIVVANLAALAAALAVSVGTMFRCQSGPLMLAWGALWAVGAGVVGHRLRTWLWPALCPVAMLVLVTVWEVIYGRTSLGLLVCLHAWRHVRRARDDRRADRNLAGKAPIWLGYCVKHA